MQSTELKNLTIAIVGAGYAGAASAKALSLLGADVHVYEQASRIREGGAGIGLRPSTMDRVRQWGIGDYAEQTKTHLIHRGDFIDALLGVLPDGMVPLGHTLESVEDRGERSVL